MAVDAQPSLLQTFTQFAFIGGAALLVFGFVTVGKDGELRRRCAPTCALAPEYVSYARKAPEFTLKDMTGKEVRLSDFRGKVVVLNFWTKTCGPCLEEFPDLVDAAKVLQKHDDVVVLGVSTDDGPDDVKDTLQSILKEPVPFPIVFDPEAKVVSKQFGTHLFPETWIIDKNGVIRARFDGAKKWSQGVFFEYVDQLRGGGFCPMERDGRKWKGEGAKACLTD